MASKKMRTTHSDAGKKSKATTKRRLIVNLPTGPIGATQPTEIRSKSKAKMSKEINMLLNGSPHLSEHEVTVRMVVQALILLPNLGNQCLRGSF